MLIRKSADIRSSEITPKGEYLNRRSFLAAGTAALGALALPSHADATMKIDGIVKSPLSVSEKVETQRRRHALQQLLRVRYRQGRTRQVREYADYVALEGAGGRAGE